VSAPAVQRLARSLRRHAAHQVHRHAARPVEAQVKAIDPLVLDVHGSEAILTDDDVTIGAALDAHFTADGPLEVGDTLVLVETDPGDYAAVDVLR
jgi:hypothetical protein